MEREVRYFTTEDGVRIAYCVEGEGPPLLYMDEPLIQTIAGARLLPEVRAWCERVSETRQLIRLDHRGSGLSTRDVSDFSLESMERDLDALLDRLRLETVDLWGGLDSGPIAISFAAHNPGRVRRLVLWSTWARGADISDRASIEALERLMDTNWRLYCQVALQAFAGSAEVDVRKHVDIMAEATEPHTLRNFMRQAWDYDVNGLLQSVPCPTLVLSRRGQPLIPVELSSRLASSIPDARLAVLEGDSGICWLGDSEQVVGVLEDFLRQEDVALATTGLPGLRTVIFTDIVAHTEMMQRLGDERGREVLREHERIVREQLKAHGGAEVKTMGDGFMASFGWVTGAVECAIALQRAFEERNEAARRGGSRTAPTVSDPGPASAEPIRIRVGLNAGEPIEEEGDLFGTTVILASRIAAQAEGGEILASVAVRELCAGKGFLFADRGEHVLRGFEDPVRMFEVRWSFDSPADSG